MITIRQIERAWTARTYEKLFRELVEKIQSVIGKAQSEDDHPQLF